MIYSPIGIDDLSQLVEVMDKRQAGDRWLYSVLVWAMALYHNMVYSALFLQRAFYTVHCMSQCIVQYNAL